MIGFTYDEDNLKKKKNKPYKDDGIIRDKEGVDFEMEFQSRRKAKI